MVLNAPEDDVFFFPWLYSFTTVKRVVNVILILAHRRTCKQKRHLILFIII